MPAIDNSAPSSLRTQGPPYFSALVTPSDSEELAHVSDALYVTTGGTVHFRTVYFVAGEAIYGTEDTVTVPDFFVLPGRFRQILATGTTATGIHAMWS